MAAVLASDSRPVQPRTAKPENDAVLAKAWLAFHDERSPETLSGMALYILSDADLIISGSSNRSVSR